MRRLLALSPHLDDAVFSVGALLARHADAGWRVVVATCFTGSVERPEGFALACQLDKGLPADADYMALRRSEDLAACRALGAEAVHLPFLEAPHRGYDSAQALFSGLGDDDLVAEPLGQAICRLTDAYDPDLILAPLGVGDHVDHRMVRTCAEQVSRRQLRLWADLPYAARLGYAPPEPAVGHPVGEHLSRKLAACRSYETQLTFQFGAVDRIKEWVQIDEREWLQTP